MKNIYTKCQPSTVIINWGKLFKGLFKVLTVIVAKAKPDNHLSRH